jgi:hypothetical protein
MRLALCIQRRGGKLGMRLKLVTLSVFSFCLKSSSIAFVNLELHHER